MSEHVSTALDRRQIATIGTAPIGLWHDEPAREAFLGIQRDHAQEIAATENMTVAAGQKPHQVTPLFLRIIADASGEDLAVECPPDQAEIVKVRACWWATPQENRHDVAENPG